MILSFPQYLVKIGARKPGAAEKYLPWYGAAAAGGLGSLVAQEAARKKFKIPAAIMGSLAGTAAGVHGGEALGRAVAKMKKKKTASSRQEVGKRLEQKGKEWQQTGKRIRNVGYGGMLGLGLGSLAVKKKLPRRLMQVGAGLSGVGGYFGEAGPWFQGMALERAGLEAQGKPAGHIEMYSPSMYASAQRHLGSIKKAEAKEQKPPTITGTILRGLGGLGVGTAAGYGLGKALDVVAKKKGISLHKAVPLISGAAGAGLGAAYPLWKAYELDEMRKAMEAKRKKESK